jgi:hypothetical protein
VRSEWEWCKQAVVQLDSAEATNGLRSLRPSLSILWSCITLTIYFS